MSYDIFPYRFVQGAAAPMDMKLAYEVLDPHAVARSPEHDFLQLRTGDHGTADVYLNENGMMINHFGGERVMDLVAELLKRLEAVLLLPDSTVIITREKDREHLPQELLDACSVVVASTGRAITQAVQAS
ncbi:hypothetical protein [Streptomyces sp. NPDC002580]|uniref:hypothetical protein n=1 Tax=Streptomyces sp. NPDC002580 TaxID=3364653 RepID=UPI0036B06EF3